ncbi:MAG: dipeptide epimerase [Synergistales bacterium]|nr:dipeptide epimerase [Synergistales bacterium]
MKQNRITGIELYKADFGLLEPFRTSLAEISCAHNIIARIYAEDGLYGTGEARPNPPVTGETQCGAVAVGEEIAPRLLGRAAWDIEGAVRTLDRALHGNSALKSAFDIALYDLLGKIAGMPLYALLGGPKRTVVTDNTVSLAPPEEMAAKALEYKKEGFDAIKVKLGRTLDEDLYRVEQVREAVGPDVAIRLDANQGWDFKTAVRILQAMEPLRIQYCEQPLAHWDFEGLRRLRERTSIPVMADEAVFGHHDAFKLASRGCCDYLNIKLAKTGGIHHALQVNAIAEACGMTCMVGCMTESRLPLTAAAHLMSARPNIRFADLDGHRNMNVDPVTDGAVYEGGTITLPDTPGHGADYEREFLAQCPCVSVE